MPTIVNARGRYYGRLYVIKDAGRDRSGQARWLCLCECGRITATSGGNLRRGRQLSCGCLRDERASVRSRTHGETGTPTYRSWAAMLRRCRNPKCAAFKDYGGRGIAACDRWTSYENFLSDMGVRPAGTTLDRVDVNGDYCPENCRWATSDEQACNRRTTRRIEHDGRSMTISQWSRETGISRETIGRRIAAGWPVSRALSEAAHAKQAH